MFRFTLSRLVCCVYASTALLLSGCASAPRNSTAAADVKVYGPAQLIPGQYELVRRLWVDSWRTAFWMPTHTSEAAGIAALRDEAARLGANGLIYVDCLDQGHAMWSRSREPAIVCYGNAVRVK
jgi:hypothetical protein